jgi:steroid 5-alpha reductase family enzyme
VATSLFAERRARSPRQLFVAIAAAVWMTRLGTFLYNRILKDGKDERFDAIKVVWLSFLGAWTVQVSRLAPDACGPLLLLCSSLLPDADSGSPRRRAG